jgi:hypothetical protein
MSRTYRIRFDVLVDGEAARSGAEV